MISAAGVSAIFPADIWSAISASTEERMPSPFTSPTRVPAAGHADTSLIRPLLLLSSTMIFAPHRVRAVMRFVFKNDLCFILTPLIIPPYLYAPYPAILATACVICALGYFSNQKIIKSLELDFKMSI